MWKRAALVRYQLQEQGMPVDAAPEDGDVRHTYNFAPGSYGLVYRADVPERRAPADGEADGGSEGTNLQAGDLGPTKYKLQAMKWGLVPFWTKRNPDYSSVLKTINARDDSLAENRGMWTSMKKTKRCVIVAQGFYEWLKKNGGREKIPHYTKRKDGQLMLFAGLWDCVQYEGSDERHWTYTIITTESNKQLSFLHDRMPVILDNASEALRTWLDPNRSTWTSELQSLLQPYKGELDCYAVSKEVGKVGNNSADFIVPVASSENKKNIANFFTTKLSTDETHSSQKREVRTNKDLKAEPKMGFENAKGQDIKAEEVESAGSQVNIVKSDEINADKIDNEDDEIALESRGHGDGVNAKAIKLESSNVAAGAKRSKEESPTTSPRKTMRIGSDSPLGGGELRYAKSSPSKKRKSADSNGTEINKSPSNQKGRGSLKITNFFTKDQ